VREPVTLQRIRSLITEPEADSAIERGELAIRGVAWSGAASVARVDVSVNGGSWQEARLVGDRKRHSWQWWEFLLRVDDPGILEIRARAADLAGRTQPDNPEWNRLGYGNNAIQPIRVRVKEIVCGGEAGGPGILGRGMSAQSPSPGNPAVDFSIRRASAQDAAGIVAVLEGIAAERVYSAIDQPWNVNQQRLYLDSLSRREAFHVAISASGEISGYQSLDRYSPFLTSMAHVGQLGTFIRPEWRRRGTGQALFQRSRAFAQLSGYRKFVIQVRASNAGAQAFYLQLGFAQCGRLARQVVIDGQEDDEIQMELFL